MSKDVDMQRRMAIQFRRLTRSCEAFSDSMRLATDALTRESRSGWEFPERLLSDEERDAIDARQLARTLADIDDLPTAPPASRSDASKDASDS